MTQIQNVKRVECARQWNTVRFIGRKQWIGRRKARPDDMVPVALPLLCSIHFLHFLFICLYSLWFPFDSRGRWLKPAEPNQSTTIFNNQSNATVDLIDKEETTAQASQIWADFSPVVLNPPPSQSEPNLSQF